ncbi:hypothetical protein MRBLMI12_004372 [Microbacterium sp. LMI12-1-1.1]|uniref:hypothetical protein n=1 Tax=Microbacterium sp. LMI12-1-1.1 TaxID=3135225 RepID=UPI00343DDB6F
MSNRRRPALVNIYRSEFLRSRAWFARRDRWFRDQTARGIPLECAACGQPADKHHLELHHLDYTGMSSTNGRWLALEAHEDLMPLHPYCHDLLHRLIDRDPVLSGNRTRRDATHVALQRLRPKLQPADGSTP